MSQPSKSQMSDLPSRVRRHLRSLGFESESAYLAWCRKNGLPARTNKRSDQMRLELGKREREEKDGRRSASLREHLRSLGLDSVTEYRSWCSINGLGTGLYKSKTQRSRELALKRSLRTGSSDTGRGYRRHLVDTVKQMISGTIRRRELTDPLLLHIHSLVQVHRDTGRRTAFLELLGRTDTLGVSLDTSPLFEHQGGNSVDALMALAHHQSRWIRPASDWVPRTKSRRHALGSLARHLLARYPVPHFMDQVWFGDCASEQGWFIHIGLGANIRTADVPISLTKRMAHLFMSAPDTMSVTQTLRWAQVLGLQGDEGLAEHIIATRLGETLNNEDFWVSVVHFFVNNPMLDYDQIGPIVDFIHNRRFVSVEVARADGSIVHEPRDPDFSMKGRTAARILELVDAWHGELARSRGSNHVQWPASEFRPFEKIEERNGHLIRWRIDELTTRRALIDEGRAMHHCVASYAPYCARGQKSVWSLTVEDIDRGYSDRVLTIAVNNSGRRVVQARGRCNAMPGQSRHDHAATRVLRAEGDRLKLGRSIMHEWGEKESIHVPRIT